MDYNTLSFVLAVLLQVLCVQTVIVFHFHGKVKELKEGLVRAEKTVDELEETKIEYYNVGYEHGSKGKSKDEFYTTLQVW